MRVAHLVASVVGSEHASVFLLQLCHGASPLSRSSSFLFLDRHFAVHGAQHRRATVLVVQGRTAAPIACLAREPPLHLFRNKLSLHLLPTNCGTACSR